MKLPSHVASIIKLWESGVIPRGGVLHVDVAHDGGCALMNGLTTCDCKPLVTVRRNAA